MHGGWYSKSHQPVNFDTLFLIAVLCTTLKADVSQGSPVRY